MNQHTDERAEKVIIKNTIRELSSISQGQLGSDGDGVKLTRLIGNQ
jgi:hypothetical protein